jgi:hypothetical protein
MGANKTNHSCGRSGYASSTASPIKSSTPTQRRGLESSTLLTASLTGFSHTKLVEASQSAASTNSATAIVTLADATFGVGALVHDLVQRRFPGRTFRNRQGVLPSGLDEQTP